MEFCDAVMEKSWNFVATILWQPWNNSVITVGGDLLKDKCELCSKDLSRLTSQRRVQHVHMCAENVSF